MEVFWFMFAMPVLAMLAPFPPGPKLARWMWLLLGLFFTLLIGFRYQVGADWYTYLEQNLMMLNVPFELVFEQKYLGYAVLNWFSAYLGGGIYLVNLVCGAVLMLGVVTFARNQPQPLLALLVALPYMIIVVGMGYTRQATAMGFELLALVALMDGRLRRFVLLIICGALFHKSALVLLPLAALANTQKRLWTWFWVGIVCVVLGTLIMAEYQEALWYNYIERGRASEGGGIRVAMNALPSLLFLFFRRRLSINEYDQKLWTWIALFALACIPLVGFASTAVDRVALYFMPIQMLVFARVERLATTQNYRQILVWGVVVGYAAVLWVWLNYANHAQYWLPYRFAPFI